MWRASGSSLLLLIAACVSTPAVDTTPEPRDLVCESECEREHRRCADQPYWQQCEADLGECLDACL